MTPRARRLAALMVAVVSILTACGSSGTKIGTGTNAAPTSTTYASPKLPTGPVRLFQNHDKRAEVNTLTVVDENDAVVSTVSTPLPTDVKARMTDRAFLIEEQMSAVLYSDLSVEDLHANFWLLAPDGKLQKLADKPQAFLNEHYGANPVVSSYQAVSDHEILYGKCGSNNFSCGTVVKLDLRTGDVTRYQGPRGSYMGAAANGEQAVFIMKDRTSKSGMQIVTYDLRADKTLASVDMPPTGKQQGTYLSPDAKQLVTFDPAADTFHIVETATGLARTAQLPKGEGALMQPWWGATGISRPAWSPDSRHVAFERSDKATMSIMLLDTTNATVTEALRDSPPNGQTPGNDRYGEYYSFEQLGWLDANTFNASAVLFSPGASTAYKNYVFDVAGKTTSTVDTTNGIFLSLQHARSPL